MLEPEIIAEPYEMYRRLREFEPVHWDPYMHAWVVTSYSEALNVLMTFSADRTPSVSHLADLGLSFMTPFSEMMLQQMMFMDGTNHAQLRSICAAAFTPTRIEQLRTVIEEVAEVLLAAFLPAGHIDLVADFANPLPAIVTARLLGVPPQDHKQLHAWVLDIAEVLGNFQHHPDRVRVILGSLEELKSYILAVMAEQRRRPQDGLICALMSAEVQGRRLSDDEIVANTIITLIGGHETTTNLIASGYLTLLRNADARMVFQQAPEIAYSAVEELLRFESPVQHTARIAPSDVKLGDKEISKGSRVVAVLAAANRDPARFANPNEVDLRRSDNRHLAFGWAAHFCFGAPLARMEGQIAFNVLLRRLKNPKLSGEALLWRENAGLRGLTKLEVAFDPPS